MYTPVVCSGNEKGHTGEQMGKKIVQENSLEAILLNIIFPSHMLMSPMH